MPNYRADEWAAWEVDPSTRTSVHAFTKYVPINATVATSAADLLTVSRGIPSVNLVTNPSLEVNTLTDFTASGAAISQSNAVTAATGTYSLLVNPDNAAAGEGFYWDDKFSGHPEGSWLVASAEVRGASASGSVKIAIQNSLGVELVASAAHSLTTTFTKISIMYSLPIHTPATYRVAVVSAAQHNIDWYTDKIHIEERRDGQIADYVDGAQGVNYEWTGTANASVSKRRAGVSVIRGLRLKNDDGSNPVYIAFDTTASAIAPFTGIKLVAGEIFETQFPIDFRTNISAIATGGNVAVHGVVWGIHQG